MKALPVNIGKFYPAMRKSSDICFVVIPFWGAVSISLDRHVDLLNSLGFDCYKMFLPEDKEFLYHRYTEIKNGSIYYQAWTEAILNFLARLPSSQKIVFSFSNVAASALEAVVHGQQYNIVGMVCDSGPGRLNQAQLNRIFRFGKKGSSLELANLVNSILWQKDFAKMAALDVTQLSKRIPILALYGSEDEIIPASEIRRVFRAKSSFISIKSVKGGHHLKCLKENPEAYGKLLKDFLRRHYAKA